MSMFADYFFELQAKETLETEFGFAIYYEFNNGMYIEEIYVKPAYRKSGVASKMADDIAEIAKTRGLKKLLGSVRPSNKTSTEAMKVLLAYGFRLDSSVVDGIAFVKELK